MNFFSGARRLAAVVALAGTALAVGELFVTKPVANVSYEVSHPGAAPVLVESCSNNLQDGQRWRDRKTNSGRDYTAYLCFPTQTADDGRQLIPYAVEDGSKTMWMNTRYSPEVDAYMDKTIAAFSQTTDEVRIAEERYSAASSERWKTRITAIAIWLVGFWLFTAIIGWIARGFAGIPRGQDHRPA